MTRLAVIETYRRVPSGISETGGLVVDGELTTFAVVTDRKDASPVEVGKPEPFVVPTRPSPKSTPVWTTVSSRMGGPYVIRSISSEMVGIR